MSVKEWLERRVKDSGSGSPESDKDLSCGMQVIVKKGGARSMKAGGPWIYDNEIDRVEYIDEPGKNGRIKAAMPSEAYKDDMNSPEPADTYKDDMNSPEPVGRSIDSLNSAGADSDCEISKSGIRGGDIVRVLDFDGFTLGYGIFNPVSKIRVRMLARYERAGITPSFFRRRVREAWEHRKAVMGPDTDSCRVIFGEADYLPGITIDKFSDVLVIESLALGTDRLKELILLDLVQVLEEDGIRIRGIYERSDARVRQLEGMDRVKGFIGPEFDTMVPIAENSIHYMVDVKDGQKTGFFLDQKYNRREVARLVRNLADGRRNEDNGIRDETGKCTGISNADRKVTVLDCFTHTGSFGLNAARAGASHVLSVDASAPAIEMAKKNAEANGLENVIEYRVADVFELLPKLEQGDPFDVVILDPPAFTKSRQATKNAVKGYREINLRGMKLVRDGGYLATCSCSHFMDEELLKKTLREAARGAGRRLRQVYFGTQAPDHPILWGVDESYYLKFFIFQVIKER